MIDKYKEAFQEEAREILLELESALLELNESADGGEPVARAFRALHTIKGSGAMFGFDDIAAFTHHIENAFDEVRNGRLAASSDLIGLTLKAVDQIKAMLDESAGRGHADPAVSVGLLAKLSELTRAKGARKDEPIVAARKPDIDTRSNDARSNKDARSNNEPALLPNAAMRDWRIQFRPKADLLRNGANPLLLFRELREMGRLEITANMDEVPMLPELDAERCYVAWDMILSTAAPVEAIRDVFIFVEDCCELTIDPVSQLAKRVADGAAEGAQVVPSALAGAGGDGTKSDGQAPEHFGADRLARQSESEIGQVAYLFKGLAARADTILQQAAAIAGLVESESSEAICAQVQSLCVAVRGVLEERLEAAATILKALEDEEKMLRQLIDVTERQEAVAVHLQALSVLTNVEVAQLGSVGGDFQLLAQELSAFSKSVSEQTRELASHTQNSRRTIAQTRREMAAELPDLQREMARMEEDIGTTLRAIDAGLIQLASIPIQFQEGAKHTAQQIAGVVSAIQGYDITRQQIEHVGTALAMVASKIAAPSAGLGDEMPVVDLPLISAGLTVQGCQLKTIRAGVTNWTSQVARCMDAIQRLSASEVAQMGPAVLNQERDLSSRLAHIEQLQQKSQDYGRTIQNTLGGLSSLLELVSENLRRFQEIRHRLQFLTFNSIVEAKRLGERGVVVSAIAELIKEVSSDGTRSRTRRRRRLPELRIWAAAPTKSWRSLPTLPGRNCARDRTRPGWRSIGCETRPHLPPENRRGSKRQRTECGPRRRHRATRGRDWIVASRGLTKPLAMWKLSPAF